MFCCMPELEAVGTGQAVVERESMNRGLLHGAMQTFRPCGGPWRLPSSWLPETDTDTDNSPVAPG